MIEFDKILLEFVGGNWMSIYVLITLAKGMALITPTVKDDAIITLLYQLFGVVRGKREPVLNAASQESDTNKRCSKTERLKLWKDIATGGADLGKQGKTSLPAEKSNISKEYISRPEDFMDDSKF